MQNIIDRLEIQVSSLQESFYILSHANSLEDLAKKFFQILRGNLLIIDANIFFRGKNDNEWQELYVKNSEASQCCELLNPISEFSIQYLDHPIFQVCTFSYWEFS